MCLSYRQMDKKSRILVGIANFSLAVGLSLRSFVHPAGASARNWLLFVVGLLIGLSITVNLYSLIRCRVSRWNVPANKL
jgi:hypothetical protein